MSIASISAKRFLFKHTALPTVADQEYPATALPDWLNHKQYAWFRDAYVLTLAVGQSVETDFHKITRIV